MTKVTVRLPLVKETAGALRYALSDQRRDLVISDLYVRKDKLREAGHEGDWPAALDVSVEVVA